MTTQPETHHSLSLWRHLSQKFKEQFGRPAGTLLPISSKMSDAIVAEYGSAIVLVAIHHWLDDKQELLTVHTNLGLWSFITDRERDEYLEQAAEELRKTEKPRAGSKRFGVLLEGEILKEKPPAPDEGAVK